MEEECFLTNRGTITNNGTLETKGQISNLETGTFNNGGTIDTFTSSTWFGSLPVLPEIFKGDINLDGVINETDLSYILKHWGESNVPFTSPGGGLISRLMDNINNRDIIIKDRDIIIKQLRNN
jgi:hypothetical protein